MGRHAGEPQFGLQTTAHAVAELQAATVLACNVAGRGQAQAHPAGIAIA